MKTVALRYTNDTKERNGNAKTKTRLVIRPRYIFTLTIVTYKKKINRQYYYYYHYITKKETNGGKNAYYYYLKFFKVRVFEAISEAPVLYRSWHIEL